MKGMYILLIIFSIVLYTSATLNKCCSNDKPILRKKGCMENGTSWIKHNCKGAYPLFPKNNKNVKLENETLILSNVTYIPKSEFCVGSLETEETQIILVCFPNVETKASAIETLRFFFVIISIFCLVITIAVYWNLSKLRDVLGKCLMCMVASLLASFLSLCIIQFNTNFPYSLCYFMAALTYFCFLCVLFWMNVVAYHIWQTIVHPSFPENSKETFNIYAKYAWGGPFVLSIIANIAFNIPGNHLKPTWTYTTCWFSDYYSRLLYFDVPMLLILIANLIMFILSAITLQKYKHENNKLRSRRYRFKLCLKLFLTMGICWIFEPLSAVLHFAPANMWIVTDCLNSLQGLIILLLLVVFRKRVRRELARHGGFCCKKLPQNWASLPDEDCEELSEEIEKLEAGNEELLNMKRGI